MLTGSKWLYRSFKGRGGGVENHTKTILNHLEFPQKLPKVCQTEAQDDCFYGPPILAWMINSSRLAAAMQTVASDSGSWVLSEGQPTCPEEERGGRGRTRSTSMGSGQDGDWWSIRLNVMDASFGNLMLLALLLCLLLLPNTAS